MLENYWGDLLDSARTTAISEALKKIKNEAKITEIQKRIYKKESYIMEDRFVKSNWGKAAKNFKNFITTGNREQLGFMVKKIKNTKEIDRFIRPWNKGIEEGRRIWNFRKDYFNIEKLDKALSILEKPPATLNKLIKSIPKNAMSIFEGGAKVLKGNLLSTVIDSAFAIKAIAEAQDDKKAETAFREFGGVLGGLAAALLVGGLAATGVGIIPLAFLGLFAGVAGSSIGKQVGESLYNNPAVKPKVDSSITWLNDHPIKAIGTFMFDKANEFYNINSASENLTQFNFKKKVDAIDRINNIDWTNTPFPNGSYFMPYSTGLSYVPYDGFPAMLHKGERVMTASENRAYSNPVRAYTNNSVSKAGNVFNITINGVNKSADDIINELVYKLSEAVNTMGEVAFE